MATKTYFVVAAKNALSCLAMHQFARLFEIDRQIRDGVFPNADALAAQFEVTPRQVQYDCARLKAMGAPIRHHRVRGGWHYTDPTWILPAMRLSEGELLAFFLAVRVAREAANTPFAAELESAVEKLRRALGDPVSVDLNALEQVSFAAPPAMPADDANRWQLSRAQAARRKVSMVYRTGETGQTKTRVFHPYHVHDARGEWLVFGHDELRDELRTFNIARIESLKTLDAHFERPLDFDAQNLLDSMLWAQAGAQIYPIALWFDAYQARFIRERTYHSAQTLYEQPNGELILRFPASGLAEVARFVLGFGAHCEVLEPPELRALVREHVAKMGEIYGGNDDE